jgi:hypothetical protein
MTAMMVVTTACTRPRSAQTRDPEIGEIFAESHSSNCVVPKRGDRNASQWVACTASPREVRAWGSPPRELPPTSQCPVRVRVAGDGSNGVIAETLSILNAFDTVPWDECVPSQYLVGARRAFRVDDGWLVAYTGLGNGEMFWSSEDGRERKLLSGARVAGFTRARSGTVLALAIGRARLGRGGVLALDHGERGEYAPRLIATLPIEPSPVAFDDDGVLVGFAGGFIFRVDESGKVENVHYVARPVGRVASIAKSPNGVYYLGLECGILRLVPDEQEGGYREEWWSARNGASGRWTPCLDG